MIAHFLCFLDKRDAFKVLHDKIRMFLSIIIAEYQYFCKNIMCVKLDS